MSAAIEEQRQVALADGWPQPMKVWGDLAFREAVPKSGTAALALMELISRDPRGTSLEHSARPPEKNRRDFIYL